MKVVIHQPDFLSYLGFFRRLTQCDHFVVLDDAQFVSGTSRSWTHRDRIKTAAGPRWLTLRVNKAPLGTPINRISLVDSPAWRQDCLNLVREHYRTAEYFDEVFPELQAIFANPETNLAKFNVDAILRINALLDINVPLAHSSALATGGKSTERLIAILRKVGATSYLSGVGARAYLDESLFVAAGIELQWQQFDHPRYVQLHGEFEPNLSCIDLLLNCGVEQSRRVLKACR